MMVVPAPSAIIVSCDSLPEADRSEKTVAEPIPAAKISTAIRYFLANSTSPGMFSLFQRSFAGVNERRAGIDPRSPWLFFESAPPSGEAWKLRKENAAAFTADLGKLDDRRRRVGNKPESPSRPVNPPRPLAVSGSAIDAYALDAQVADAHARSR